MLTLERRNKILELLQNEKRVLVSDLSKSFQVSEETIRRDLEKLERDGFCQKSYGGAVFNENLPMDLPFPVRKNKNVVEKQRMADLIIPLVSEGESLFLDASTTAVYVARALKSFHSLTCITNSLEILLELSDRPDWTVVGTGGVVSDGYLAMLGDRAVESIRSFYTDTAIFSCKALHRDFGLFESREEFLAPKRAMMAHSRRRILVADSTKFDKTSLAANPSFGEIDVCVTDQEPSASWKEFFKGYSISCLYPERTLQTNENL